MGNLTFRGGIDAECGSPSQRFNISDQAIRWHSVKCVATLDANLTWAILSSLEEKFTIGGGPGGSTWSADMV